MEKEVKSTKELIDEIDKNLEKIKKNKEIMDENNRLIKEELKFQKEFLEDINKKLDGAFEGGSIVHHIMN